ncbi:MAG: O-antigen ligase domain-containing protein [Acidobacteria bacterium]|nr:MAG: O-antigen ligase domain-containing protein [Acidobacteriota bacterium]
MLAWVTFLAGGVYPWVWVPAACAVAALALSVKPRVAADRFVRATDGLLAVTAAAIALQLVPVPASLLRAIDPQALAVRASLWLTDPTSSGAVRLPITIAPGDSFAALGIFASAALFFRTCRQICDAGGAGRIVRAVAILGLIASIAAIVQRAQRHDLLYGFWRPIDAGARPYGPFVNRNHFATWAVMACPLVFGYLLARVPDGRRPHLISQRVVAALTQLGSMRIWLVSAVCVMTLALLISASRSGLIALMGATLVSMLLGKGRAGPGIRRWTMVQLVLLALVGLAFANFDALLDRFDETMRPLESGRGRSAIWADARRVIADFPATGTGVGTFGAAIAVYQTAEPGYSIGNAHNHYLQLAAEGGLLVGVPAAFSIGAFFALCLRRFREDGSPDYLMRAGAIAGIAAVLLQSVWETGLRMPANAMLLAVLSAIATHSPTGSGSSRASSRDDS